MLSDEKWRPISKHERTRQRIFTPDIFQGHNLSCNHWVFSVSLPEFYQFFSYFLNPLCKKHSFACEIRHFSTVCWEKNFVTLMVSVPPLKTKRRLLYFYQFSENLLLFRWYSSKKKNTLKEQNLGTNFRGNFVKLISIDLQKRTVQFFKLNT